VRTARTFPRVTSRDVVSKILHRRQHYHFGAGRISLRNGLNQNIRAGNQ
jgi:hypothetical protein